MPNKNSLRKTQVQKNFVENQIQQELSDLVENSNIQEVKDLFTSSFTHDVQAIGYDPTKVIGEEGAIERDKAYTDLLSKFSENYNAEKRQIKRQKTWFFYSVLVLLFIMGFSGILLLFLALNTPTLNNLGVVIGATVDIFATFVAIPSIIARHLFPEKIDEKIVEVVKVLLENDKDIRNAAEHRHNEK